MLTLKINGKSRKIDADPDTPLLWVLRDLLGMNGTKFGCASRSAAPARCTWTASPGDHGADAARGRSASPS